MRAVSEDAILRMAKYLSFSAQLFKLLYMHQLLILTIALSLDLYLPLASQNSPILVSHSYDEPNTSPLTPLNRASILQPRDP
jgi:hypothetical protein